MRKRAKRQLATEIHQRQFVRAGTHIPPAESRVRRVVGKQAAGKAEHALDEAGPGANEELTPAEPIALEGDRLTIAAITLPIPAPLVLLPIRDDNSRLTAKKPLRSEDHLPLLEQAHGLFCPNFGGKCR